MPSHPDRVRRNQPEVNESAVSARFLKIMRTVDMSHFFDGLPPFAGVVSEHGIDCDCPPCRNRLMTELGVNVSGAETLTRKYDHDFSLPHQWWCGGKEPCACTDGWKEQHHVQGR